MDVPQNGKKYEFICDNWLDKKEGDGLTERILEVAGENTGLLEYKAKIPYEVVVCTSDVRGAGTDANVFMDVYGKDESGVDQSDHVEFTTATKSSFERNQEDRFNFDLEDVGKPYKIRIGHDGKGFGAGWHLDKVRRVIP